MNIKRKKFLIAAVLAAATSLTALSACAGGTQEDKQAYRPESPSISLTPPADGSAPEDYGALENVGYVIGRLASRECYHSENTNTAQATSLGFINVTQNVVGSKDYLEGLLITSTVSTSSSSFAPSKAIQKYYGDRKVIVRTAASSSRGDWDGLNTAWSEGAPSEMLDEGAYGEKYGLWATEFSDLVINDDTVLSASELSRSGENYSVTLTLNTEGANDAAYYYKKNMVTMGELSGEPQFESLSMTIEFAPDWSVLSYSTDEVYTSAKGIISAKVHGTSLTTFSYERSDVDVSAYENYFSKYDEGQNTQLSAQYYIDEGMADIFAGGTLGLEGSLNGSKFSAALAMRGNADAVELMQLNFGDAVIEVRSGKLLLKYGGLVGGIDMPVGAMRLRGDSVEIEGGGAVVGGAISLAGIDIPAEFTFDCRGGEIALTGISGEASFGSGALSLSMTPADSGSGLIEIDESAAADLTPAVGDIADMLSGGRLAVSAQYSAQEQTVLADISLELGSLVAGEGIEAAELGLTVVDKDGASVYVRGVFAEGVLYASCSQADFDAPGALRLRISAEKLSEAFDKLKPVLGMLGAGTGDIDFAAVFANASLTAGRDENSDNTVTVSGASAGEGTLSATLTMVVRGETQPITAPADGESYKDIAFLSQLAGDVAGTVAQLATGYDLSLSLKADMLGMLTLADVDIDVKIALDEAGAVQALITADVNAGGGLFYGATHTQIALSGGYISIVRTQTSTFGESLGSTTNTPLEEPVTTCRTMTAAHFLGDLAGQLFYALNVNEQTIESLMGMMGGMGIAEGEEAAPADIGDYLTGFSGDEGGYSLSLDLGKLLGMDASAGMTGSAVIAIERGDGVLSSLNASATLLGLVNANVSAVNNAPGTPVELSALADLCGQAALLLGYDSYADLLAAVAAGGCVSSAQ